MKQFEVWCNAWFKEKDCGVEDKNICPIRMAYEGEEAIRECAERSTPKKGGAEIMDKKIQLVTTIGLLLLDSMGEK